MYYVGSSWVLPDISLILQIFASWYRDGMNFLSLIVFLYFGNTPRLYLIHYTSITYKKVQEKLKNA